MFEVHHWTFHLLLEPVTFFVIHSGIYLFISFFLHIYGFVLKICASIIIIIVVVAVNNNNNNTMHCVTTFSLWNEGELNVWL